MHVSVAAYLGIGADAKRPQKATTPDTLTAELGPSRGRFRPPIPIQNAVQTPAPDPNETP